MDLAGKCILITGSATGIGEAMARLCHAKGANVVIHGKEEEDARRVTEDLGERVLERTDDLADPATPERLVNAIVEAFGRIDSLVNKFDGGPVGLESLSVAISEDSKTIEEVYEPYLIKEGFMQRTSRGRIAQNKAQEYFKKVKE